MQQVPCAPDEPSDAAIMRRLAGGDTASLGLLAKRHQDRVRVLAYRHTRRWDVADDITQEAFLRLWRGAGRYQPTAAFTTWLYRIVVNLCLDWNRRPRLAAMPDDVVRAEPDADHADVAARVQAVVAALPERQRMVILLHRFESMSHAQIASVTGWSESAVESLLVRAYASLRRALKDMNPAKSVQDSKP